MMRKFFAVAALVVAFAVLSGSAFAEVQKFDGFSIDVPNGWKVEKDEETVGFIAPDESAAISVSMTGMDAGETVEEYANAFAKELKGSTPKKEDDSLFHFEFKNEHGVTSKAMVTGDGKKIALVIVTGEHADIDKMINSLQ